VLKAPGNKRSELIYDGPLSIFVFDINLRRYIKDECDLHSFYLARLTREVKREINIRNAARKAGQAHDDTPPRI
jgi:hypothetical protein